ncbi:MAG: monofunctional biosynthetic peptidoglycan transglycosylase [Bacteroidales bacterium]|nr:monofunctional biosynthetic peptidoglycan transglycosylase [Bacteroidales bacterium]
MNKKFFVPKSFFIKTFYIIRNLVVVFVLFSIMLIFLYRWMPIAFTPLMVIRSYEQWVATNEKIKFQYKWVSIDSISPYLWKAAIASEDGFFLNHWGFDWDAIRYAYEYNKTHKKKIGGSTISQQTAKNVFLWPDRTWVRKGLEAYFTILIELIWGKRRIMEVYLNVVEMGPGIYGVKAASYAYFKKHPYYLNASEAALLIATLPNPRKWNPYTRSPILYRRQQRILKNMSFYRIDVLERKPYSEMSKWSDKRVF